MSARIALLDARGVVAIGGPDRAEFLQGLITNDVGKITEKSAIYAALLTAQGRFLHDFFLVSSGDSWLLDGEAARIPDLIRRLTIYRLRSKVTLTPRPDLAVCAVFDGEPPLNLGISFVDPRNPALGFRMIVPRENAAALVDADAADYDRLRLALGVPDGARDLVPEKSLPMESGFDTLNGIDWNKGCYIGQELTARMKYRALAKKQLMPVSVTGPMPPPGTAIMAGDDEVGEMRSGRDGVAIAILRFDAVDKPLQAGDAGIMPYTRLLRKVEN